MSDPDGDTIPRVSRSELRRLRDTLVRDDSPLSVELTSPEHPVVDGSAATILTVCTGNICRSPMAELLLRAALRDVNVRVHSAGTHALVGHEMTEQAQQLAVTNGADGKEAAAHQARLLIPALLSDSDLVLTMARSHRSHAVQLAPLALHRSFTVREFGRLAATLTGEAVRRGVTAAGPAPGPRLRALARLVGAQRGLVAASADDDDVVDPYRRSQTTYELSASQLIPAVIEVSRVVRAALV